jgi:hypothetical protein
MGFGLVIGFIEYLYIITVKVSGIYTLNKSLTHMLRLSYVFTGHCLVTIVCYYHTVVLLLMWSACSDERTWLLFGMVSFAS